MALTEKDKLDRIGAALYRKVMKMKDVAEFKNWAKVVTPQGFKDFIKSALQEAIDVETLYLTELGKVKKNIDS